jgi:metal-responsive CopG/Arc/MetJ family transcriptional regulator
LKRRDKFRNGRLNSIRRDSDEHKEGHQCIEVSVINGGKGPYHKEMVKEIEQVEEANTDEHHSCMSEKLIFKS